MGLFRKGSLFGRLSDKRKRPSLSDEVSDTAASSPSRPRSYTTGNVPPPARSSRKSPVHIKKAPTATVLPRSVSMTALPTLTPEALKPRISRLESLEATMASIEVSLSSDPPPRRKGSQSSRSSSSNKSDAGRVMPVAQRKLHDINVANDRITKLIQEIEMLRHGIQEKDTLISDLQIQNQSLQNKQLHNGYDELNKLKSIMPPVVKMTEVQQKRERFQQIEREIENKQTVIKNLQLSMDKSEATDLDARIRQAELEFQLEREELSILNLQQEQIAVKTFLEEKANENLINNSTEVISFYSMLMTNRCMSLIAVEVPYNPQSPNFVISAHPSGHGLFVQWARDNSTLQKGDRLLEVNGHVILGGSRDDLVQILSNATTTEPLRMTILRSNNAPNPAPRRVNTREMENLKEEIASVVKKLDIKIRENKELHTNTEKLKKERDKLQKENMKLNHRISFLEDQVAELQQSWEDLRVTLNQVDLEPVKMENGVGTKAHHHTKEGFPMSNKVNGNATPPSSSYERSEISNSTNHHKMALKGTTSIVVNHNSPQMSPVSNNGNAISVVRTNSSGSSVSIGSSSTSSGNSERRTGGLYPLKALPNKCVVNGSHNKNTRDENLSSPSNSATTTLIKNSMNVALNAASKSQSFTVHKTTKSSSLSCVPSLLSQYNNQQGFSGSNTDKPNVGVIHQRLSSASVNLIGPSIMKSQSISQLDNTSDHNTEYSHHILQVHVPFSEPNRADTDKTSRPFYTNGHSSGFTPLTRSASANCPMTYSSSTLNEIGGRDVAYYSPKNGFRLHKPPPPPPRRPQAPASSTESDTSAPLAIHLKMNNTKIALDDFESDNEEWC